VEHLEGEGVISSVEKVVVVLGEGGGSEDVFTPILLLSVTSFLLSCIFLFFSPFSSLAVVSCLSYKGSI
jgi:hypothetical protein